jgi:hypothetical protein
MDPVTIDDSKKELQSLLAQIQANPSRDWTSERARIVVLQQMIAGEAHHPGG